MRIVQIIIIFRQLPEISYGILIFLNDSRRCESARRSAFTVRRSETLAGFPDAGARGPNDSSPAIYRRVRDHMGPASDARIRRGINPKDIVLQSRYRVSLESSLRDTPAPPPR
jgi:hypothetical protein